MSMENLGQFLSLVNEANEIDLCLYETKGYVELIESFNIEKVLSFHGPYEDDSEMRAEENTMAVEYPLSLEDIAVIKNEMQPAWITGMPVNFT